MQNLNISIQWFCSENKIKFNFAFTDNALTSQIMNSTLKWVEFLTQGQQRIKDNRHAVRGHWYGGPMWCSQPQN